MAKAAAKATKSNSEMTIHGIEPYKPKKNEEYMNEAQKDHFRAILGAWKKELMEEVDRTMSHMKDEAANFPDPADRATQEEEFALELRTRDRERKLIKKIDSTLEHIEQDEYGCRVEIPPSDHPMRVEDISPFALEVCDTLRDAGYEAYIVGGCVRDALLGMEPKDFDVATDATPEQSGGEPPSRAMDKAASSVLSEQVSLVSIPKRFSLAMRDTWYLQTQLHRRQGDRADKLLEHAKFRAAYDFLIMREESEMGLSFSRPELPNYVVIEGPIGVGKSTLARSLAHSLNYETLLEQPEENPFLNRFYQDKSAYALQTQLSFLFQRIRQLDEIAPGDMFQPTKIADFMLEKDALFAEVTLDRHELELYLKVYEHVVTGVHRPDLVVYLQAPVSVLMERVKHRGIEAEKHITVTPEDAGCQDVLIKRLERLGFSISRLGFEDVDNFWAIKGSEGPVFCFAGHTDVVPSGPVEDWSSPPFEPELVNGFIRGRGAADMKGSLAAMVTACERFVEQHPDHKGAIAFLITSDEEGVAINGTAKVVEWLQQQGTTIDWCLVGEPSSTTVVGDVIKNGRRGSLGATLTVTGLQGHVAYPQLARNPIHQAAPALTALANEIWDQGNEYFPATSFQISNIRSGTGATNVIPGTCEIAFNFRFCTEQTPDKLKLRTEEILQQHQLDFELDWWLSGMPFLTERGPLVEAAIAAITETNGAQAELSTAGGTSDGRFIAPTGAQVLELGPVNATIHQVNEEVSAQDLDSLSQMYQGILARLLVSD
eukprot:g4309.t1